MDTWIKITIIALLSYLVYREILKSARAESPFSHPKEKPRFIHFLLVGFSVGSFVYAGVSITNIQTRDLRPYRPLPASQMVSIFDKGVIELNGHYIKTNLAHPKELKPLADQLTKECHGNDGCEIQNLFNYVTHIPYRTDHTSRNAKEVVKTNWGDCDDKSNLFASLLNERGFEYKFVYVPNHVFVVVHVVDERSLPFLSAHITIEGKKYYYAETTATGSKIGEFNGQFPVSFEGIYDIAADSVIDLEKISFGIG